MKKYIYILIVGLVVLTGSCSKDYLNTNPTDQTTPEQVFLNVENAFAALNGIYRNFYTDGDLWSTSYAAENFGPSAINIATDLMGEDMIQRDAGNYWFVYDYLYWMRTSIAGTSDHPYTYWYMYYCIIDNVNNILSRIDDLPGDATDRNNVKGQALALRAYSYLYLIQFYARTYKGHEQEKGVPIYTEPTNKNSVGKGRGTVQDVFDQINEDLDNAITAFQSASAQRHKSHIDKYVAYGLKSRVAMLMEDWTTAADASSKALEKNGLKIMSNTELLGGFNTVANPEWMWGSEVNDAQSTSWNSFFNHMDSRISSSYANSSRKVISKWLYEQIGDNDVRKQWFKAPVNTDEYENPDEYAEGPDVNYNQMKFKVKGEGSWAGDYIYMRAAEMYLNQAEAECRQGNYPAARTLMLSLLEDKDPDIAARLAAIPNGNVITVNSYSDDMSAINLLDFILLQRRIELWGEGFRIFDIRRQKTGFIRDYPETNHFSPGDLGDYGLFDVTDPESWEWVYMLPQSEFDGNPSLDPEADQNP
jgi:hypothetical protein